MLSICAFSWLGSNQEKYDKYFDKSCVCLLHIWIMLFFFFPVYIQFSLLAQSCPTLCESMDCSMPGFTVHHHLPELAQTHIHWVSDAIQPSHPLPSLSHPAFNLIPASGSFLMSQFFASGGQSIKASLQHQSFQWIFRTDFLWDGLVWSSLAVFHCPYREQCYYSTIFKSY